jgi:proline dehydrogenase
MPLLRSTFLSLSRNSSLRSFAENSRLGRRMSSRFVAGVRIEDAVQATRQINRQGMAATLDHLGENVQSPEHARNAAQIYHRLLDQIQALHLDANISVKLSQMGIGLDRELASEIVAALVQHAVAAGSFVRIDMEGSAYTQATLEIVRELHSLPGNAGHVGVVVQAYLRRSEADVAALLKDGIRMRLCKGAYKEPPDLAFPDKAEVDANFVKLAQTLLSSGIFHGIATHDWRMIAAVQRFAEEHHIRDFEFQMLYGIRRDLQRSLAAQGHRVRVYIPFGGEWYPYFMRRLAERPANVLFLAKHFAQD